MHARNLLVVALLAGAAVAQESRLTLTLTAPKAEYALLEPVVLDVVLANAGKTPAQIVDELPPEFGTVRYFARAEGGEELRFAPGVHACGAGFPVTLNPGEARGAQARLSFGTHGWVFAEAGTWTVRAVYDTRGTRVESAGVSFTVRKPAGAEELRAAELLKSVDAGLYLYFDGGDHLRNGISVLESVVREAPTSIQAAHARLAFGLNLSRDTFIYRENRPRPAQPAIAAEHLEAALQADLAAPARAQATLALARCYQSTKRTDEARKLLDAFVESEGGKVERSAAVAEARTLLNR
jgi:hypothetical protein